MNSVASISELYAGNNTFYVSRPSSQIDDNININLPKSADSALTTEDVLEVSETQDTKEYTLQDLENEFEQIKKEQGIVGQTWDKIKNKFDFLSKIGCTGSKEIEEILAKAESGEISMNEAKEKIDKYKENQKKGTDVVLNAATLAVVTGVLLLAGPFGWGAAAVLGIGCLTGTAARIGFGAIEAATNDVKGDYTAEDMKEDGVQGFTIGLLSSAGKLLGVKLKNIPPDKTKDCLDNIPQCFKMGYGLLSEIKN